MRRTKKLGSVIVSMLSVALICGCGREVVHEGKTVSEWIGEWKSDNAESRRAAAKALGELGPKAKVAVPDLAAALQDEDEDDHALSALALWSIGKDAAAAVDDLCTAFRGAAVHALAKINKH